MSSLSEERTGFGKAKNEQAVIVSSGRCVHESLAAAEICSQRGIETA